MNTRENNAVNCWLIVEWMMLSSDDPPGRRKINTDIPGGRSIGHRGYENFLFIFFSWCLYDLKNPRHPAATEFQNLLDLRY